MPKQVHRIPGIKPLEKGGYQARVSHQGFEESQNFRVLDDARRWQTNLKTDLQRAPEGIARKQKNWVANALGPDGVATEEFENLDEAITWQNQAKALLRHGEPLPSRRKKVVFSTFALEWLESKYSDGKSRKGTYASQLKLHVLPHLGEIDVRAVSTLQIQDWVESLSLAGVGNETIRGSAGAVRQIFSLAHKRGLIAKTPWVAITLPGAKRSRKAKAFNESDFLRLAKECGPQELFVLVLGLCGLRIGEATALQKKHLNLKQGVINVRQAWHRDKAGKRHLGPPKNGEEREVPIPPRLVQDLTSLWQTIDEEDYLFVGAKGGPLNGDFFRKKWFRPAAQRLGLTGATVHMLRHTCASLLIRIGTPITTVSAILGHSGVEITLKTYAHFYVEDSFAAMAKLSDHFDSYTE